MNKTFQEPKGTRDFYPDAMAVRRYIEDTWRRASLRHGFVEVDGPTFEFLDLYKVKSGDEIVSQLFHFRGRADKEGQFDEYALRPEFTPTLARMIAAKANSLPRPIKWFSIPRCYRGETPQKGRLREFIQWNIDIVGGDTPAARRQFDLETLAVCIDALRDFGLTQADIQVRWNDRALIENLFACGGVPPERYPFGFYLLDRLQKLDDRQRQDAYKQNTCAPHEIAFFERLASGANPLEATFWEDLSAIGGEDALNQYRTPILNAITDIETFMTAAGMPGFCQYDASIVRGLAYYTGFVWEIVDKTGNNRAVAGGGRYDRLVELFGGPSLPASGFGMGDAVLEILLREKNKMPASVAPRPDVFVINALDTPDEATRILAALRTSIWNEQHTAIMAPGLAAVTSYKATKNIGKLLQDAATSGARVAIILAPAEVARGVAKLKDLTTREEREIPLTEAVEQARQALSRPGQ